MPNDAAQWDALFTDLSASKLSPDAIRKRLASQPTLLAAAQMAVGRVGAETKKLKAKWPKEVIATLDSAIRAAS